MFRHLYLLFKDNTSVRKVAYLFLAGSSCLVGMSATKGVAIAIDEQENRIEDSYLTTTEAQEWQKVIPGSFLSDLRTKVGNLLNVNSLDDKYWLNNLKANNKELTPENLLSLKNKCREIYNTPLSDLNGNTNLKKKYYDFVKFNCRKPRTSLDKFRDNGILIARKDNIEWVRKNTKTDSQFWARVELFNSENNSNSRWEKLRNYCKHFPKENPTSFKPGYSQEEREYLRYCL